MRRRCSARRPYPHDARSPEASPPRGGGNSSGRHAQTYNTRVQSKVRSLANLAAASATCQPAAAARRSQARRGAHPPRRIPGCTCGHGGTGRHAQGGRGEGEWEGRKEGRKGRRSSFLLHPPPSSSSFRVNARVVRWKSPPLPWERQGREHKGCADASPSLPSAAAFARAALYGSALPLGPCVHGSAEQELPIGAQARALFATTPAASQPPLLHRARSNPFALPPARRWPVGSAACPASGSSSLRRLSPSAATSAPRSHVQSSSTAASSSSTMSPPAGGLA